MASQPSSQPSIVGIKAIVRKRLSSESFCFTLILIQEILENIVRSVQPAGRYKILVLDKPTLRIVNSAVKMSELTDENVTLVEPLEKRRQPYPSLEALYLMAPTADSVMRIIEDFTRNKYNRDGRLYASAHLFFTGPLDDRLFHRIKTSTAKHYVKTLREVYMDFIPLESQVFTLERPHSLISFFGTEVSGEQMTKEYMTVARQIASFCVTIGEFPLIRYSAANNFDRVTSKLAALVYEELDKYSRSDSSFPSNDAAVSGPNKAQLIIVDRTIDTLAPFLHEFTYQSMANDLLPLTDGGTRYKYSYTSSVEGKKDKEVVLDEAVDPLWASIRHAHIAECVNQIIGSFNKFLTDNRAASGMTSGKKDVSSLNELKETLSAIPQFQELKNRFSVHMAITQECLNVFKSRKLMEVGAVEQDLATGETADGEIPKHIETDMIPLLDDPNVSIYDKVRLLIIYVISKEGLKDEDRRKLFEHAKIGSELTSAITNLALLGVKLSYSKQKKSSKKEKKSKKRDDDVPYELSRYTPVLKKIMMEACDGSLDRSIFPFIKDPSFQGTYGNSSSSGSSSISAASLSVTASATTPSAVTSLRSTKPSWHNRNQSDASAVVLEKKEDERKKGGKIIVFVVGGATFSELKSAYDVGSVSRKDVILGSTHVSTPNDVVDDLVKLKSPLVIPEEKTAGQASEEMKTSMNSLNSGTKEKKKKGFKAFMKKLVK